MKWYKFSDDLGDGTVRFRRYRTREEAQAARDILEDDPGFLCDGDGSPVIEVDTDSSHFFEDED